MSTDEVEIYFTYDANERKKTLPPEELYILETLFIEDLRQTGGNPLELGWRNLSPLVRTTSKRAFYCYLREGTNNIVVWEINNSIINIIYVGTIEDVTHKLYQ
jgi:hypothetical protein